MNLLMAPLLVINLLASSSASAADASSAQITPPGEVCVVETGIQCDDARLDLVARKHTEFYLLLIRAQQEANAGPAQYSVSADPVRVAKIQAR